MSFFRFVFLSLRNDFTMHCAVGFGILIAAAVLTGALLIGDSMRGSLRDLTLDRLGPVEGIVSSDIFVREKLAEELETELHKSGLAQTATAPVILLSAGTQYGERTAGITLIGCSDKFWTFFEKDMAPPSQWNRDEILINDALADALKNEQKIDLKSETISLWVSRPELVPADSALGRREETLFRKRLTVREILPNHGIGRFSLLSDQKPQPLAIVPLRWLQDHSRLNVPEKINTIAIANSGKIDKNLKNAHIPAKIDDLGIVVQKTPDGVIHIQSTRLIFTDTQADALEKTLQKIADPQPELVYLLETIRPKEKGTRTQKMTPYSLVAAIDELHLGDSSFTIPENEIVLNDWTSDDLGVKEGDSVVLTYFDPESVYGQTASKSITLKIAKVVPMRGTANDPELVPEIDGVSDADSLANWNPPFPFDAKKIRDKDEKYWDDHKTTPKAFVSLKTGQKLWGSRFGKTTTFLLGSGRPEAGGQSTVSLPEITTALESLSSNPAFGLSILPVKELGLKASAGTTPFNVLFLSFSFFIIASALMLLVLLFKLSIERKSDQLGTLLALGFSRHRIFTIYAAEGGLIALGGTITGIFAGILYAKFLIYGLHHWWVDAIVVPFLTLHVSPGSLILGFLCTLILSLAVIFASLRTLLRHTPLQLLRGNTEDETIEKMNKNKLLSNSRLKFWVSFVSIVATISLLILAATTRDQVVRAGAFFGVATVVLVFCLWKIRGFLSRSLKTRKSVPNKTLASLAFSNAARNPERSMLCVGLLASTSFLVLAVGAFHLDAGDSRLLSGFTLIAETQLPVYFDLNSQGGRDKLSMQPGDSHFLDKNQIQIFPFRVRSGENAGCLNLYRPRTPRILGIGDAFQRQIKSQLEEERQGQKNRTFFGTDRWGELNQPMERDDHGVATVPVILDANTAMYSLHLYKGVGEIYTLDDGRGTVIRCKIVALLSNSFLQGDILMGEANMLQLFPEVNGFRYFLAHQRFTGSDEKTIQETRRILTDTIGDFGLSTETTQDRLNRFFAIQNTYLSTFRSLGSIGLFLGTFGMGVVQLRNVLQRRKELALLQAIGFGRFRLLRLVVSESVLLLAWGVGIGAFTAMIALIPQQDFSAFFLARTASLLRQCFPVCLGMFLVGFLSNLAASFTVVRSPIAKTLAKENSW